VEVAVVAPETQFFQAAQILHQRKATTVISISIQPTKRFLDLRPMVFGQPVLV
jgi:hypothetical protein